MIGDVQAVLSGSRGECGDVLAFPDWRLQSTTNRDEIKAVARW
jgi:hypothetical protein